MTKLLKTPWMMIIIAALVYLGATVAFWKTPVVHVTTPDGGPAVVHASVKGPSWEFVNPEADQLMSELRAEKDGLAKKEKDLNDLANRLQAERAELNLVSQSVRQLQTDFDQNVVRIGEDETANLKKLSKVYSSMEPASAANILQEMDDTAMIKIMIFMKEIDTAAILDNIAKRGPLQAKRAAVLSDHIRLLSLQNKTATASNK